MEDLLMEALEFVLATLAGLAAAAGSADPAAWADVAVGLHFSYKRKSLFITQPYILHEQ